jgi:hypothetical protein
VPQLQAQFLPDHSSGFLLQCSSGITGSKLSATQELDGFSTCFGWEDAALDRLSRECTDALDSDDSALQPFEHGFAATTSLCGCGLDRGSRLAARHVRRHVLASNVLQTLGAG